MSGEVGRMLDPPARWVRTLWDEPDLLGPLIEGLDGSSVTFLYELTQAGAVLRSIELIGRDLVPLAAASLAEFWQAQDYRHQAQTPALAACEAQYGGLPEGSERDWGEYPHLEISRDDFEAFWQSARSYLATRPRNSHFAGK